MWVDQNTLHFLNPSSHFCESYFYVIHIFKKNVNKIIVKKFLVNKIYV